MWFFGWLNEFCRMSQLSQTLFVPLIYRPLLFPELIFYILLHAFESAPPIKLMSKSIQSIQNTPVKL